MMAVRYLGHMGDDLTVVNAARVSFSKTSTWEYPEDELGPARLSARDTKLILYLAKHGHWTPFAHPQISLYVKAPIFVARQLAKHQVGMVWNEVSRRYVDDEPEFFVPAVWRSRPEDSIKQGSGGVFEGSVDWHTGSTYYPETLLKLTVHKCLKLYQAFLEAGIAPEQARMVLPQSMMTEWHWTGSLAAWARVYTLRSKAQAETADVAKMIAGIIEPLFPVSWRALTEADRG